MLIIFDIIINELFDYTENINPLICSSSYFYNKYKNNYYVWKLNKEYSYKYITDTTFNKYINNYKTIYNKLNIQIKNYNITCY
jgi:hypothetical protein